MNKIQEYNKTIFESIKHIDENQNEYWYARELQKILEYSTWQKFLPVIEKAKINCINSKFNELDHFNQSVKMVKTGSNAKRKLSDYKLSRYACYLILLNSDSKKRNYFIRKNLFFFSNKKTCLRQKTIKM